MISLHKCSDLAAISHLKAQYLQSLVAPMDGMWEVGFTDPSPHWEIRMDGQQAGYYAANDDGTLLQFFVVPAFHKHAPSLFDRVIAGGALKQAVVSTIDPTFLALCLDVQKQVTVHTYLYEANAEVLPSHPEAEGVAFRLVEPKELQRTVTFQQACLGGEQDLTVWLKAYSGSLIVRKELFVLSRDDQWLGLGEYRRSDSQEGVVDLGMMVAPVYRRKGWATYILARLRADSDAQRLRAICSTTVENAGAQKAIERAGFVSRHRILHVAF